MLEAANIEKDLEIRLLNQKVLGSFLQEEVKEVPLRKESSESQVT